MSDLNNRVGEVIEAGTTEFISQCYELYQAPSLGSLVKTFSPPVEIYGVIYNAATSGIEPGRRPIARGKDEPSEEAVYKTSPQLLKLLKTEFTALVIGHRVDGKIYRYLPPQPARIHGFVYSCSIDEVKEISRSFDFLNILLNSRLPISSEELIGAALRQMGQAHEDRHAFMVCAGKELAALLGSDLNRLKAVLGRIRA